MSHASMHTHAGHENSLHDLRSLVRADLRRHHASLASDNSSQAAVPTGAPLIHARGQGEPGQDLKDLRPLATRSHDFARLLVFRVLPSLCARMPALVGGARIRKRDTLALPGGKKRRTQKASHEAVRDSEHAPARSPFAYIHARGCRRASGGEDERAEHSARLSSSLSTVGRDGFVVDKGWQRLLSYILQVQMG